MSRRIEYEENEYRVVQCDYAPCGKQKHYDGLELPRGWVKRDYTSKNGYKYKYSTEIHHYYYEGDFCCKAHAEKWLADRVADDRGEIAEYEWRGFSATAL